MRIAYKMGRVSTMILPFLFSLVFVIHTIIVYNTNSSIRILNLLGGTSLLTLLYLYIMSRVFKLCEHHRMFIYYLFTVNVICIYDCYIGIPISNLSFLLGIIISFGMCTILYGILIFKHNKQQRNETRL